METLVSFGLNISMNGTSLVAHKGFLASNSNAKNVPTHQADPGRLGKEVLEE